MDAKNGNHFWKRAIAKEMDGVRIAFDILEDAEPIPAGYTKAEGCIAFDIKPDFTRKARWVKLGNRTAKTGAPSYTGVVARDSIRIALTYAALNGLDVSAPNSEEQMM